MLNDGIITHSPATAQADDRLFRKRYYGTSAAGCCTALSSPGKLFHAMALHSGGMPPNCRPLHASPPQRHAGSIWVELRPRPAQAPISSVPARLTVAYLHAKLLDRASAAACCTQHQAVRPDANTASAPSCPSSRHACAAPRNNHHGQAAHAHTHTHTQTNSRSLSLTRARVLQPLICSRGS
jgi:hypothetical protein